MSEPNYLANPLMGHMPTNEREWLNFIQGLHKYYPLTDGERDNGVFPVNYQYRPGHVRRYGAKADGGDDYNAFQDAFDAADEGGEVYADNGDYTIKTTLEVTKDGIRFYGESRRRTILRVDGNRSLIKNGNQDTDTVMHFCMERFLITGEDVATSYIDGKSFQFSMFRDMYISGSGETGSIGIRLLGEAGTTEASHNEISNIVIGNCAGAGVKLLDIANSNTIRNVRCQPPSGAVGVDLTPNSGSNLNNVRILDCGFEFPGKVSRGVRVAAGSTGSVNGVYILGCRFESLSKGVDIDPDNASNVYVPRQANFWSSNTEDIDITQPTFADSDATPSVSYQGAWPATPIFRTANTGATTITDLDDGEEGQEVVVLFGDGNTTVDFTGTNLNGNAGADWSPAQGDHMRCFTVDGTNWYCEISDNT